jgi:two-component system, OmpR family, copper resistance phosphate regulon response regulator CusR
MKILLVEDEPKVAGFIKKGLEEEYHTVEIASDGLAGKDKVLSGEFEFVILDVNLPKLNGIELCKIIRNKNHSIPILMLTALGTIHDKVNGLEAGADDYLVKPFQFLELTARIKALTRRNTIIIPTEVYRISDLEVNSATKKVLRAGREIELTAKEYDLLEYLLKNKEKVVSRTNIAQHVWDINFDTGTNTIDVFINYLRKKIDKGFEPKLIHTLVGKGYVLSAQEYEDQR